MTFYLIGLGLDIKDISLKGAEALRKCDKIFAEFYTNTLMDLRYLERELKLKKPINILGRAEVESFKPLSLRKDTALLVPGDPLTATTHYELLAQAEKMGIKTSVVHAPSIFTAVAETGLSLYKFGRATTIPREYDPEPDSPYEVIEKNIKNGFHTLVLLDIGLNVKKALERLDKRRVCGKREVNKIMVAERLGTESAKIHTNTLENLLDKKYGEPPQCIIVPAKLDHKEEEYLAHSSDDSDF